MMYIERLFKKGRLGDAAAAQRRLVAAAKLMRDYKSFRYTPRACSPLTRVGGQKRYGGFPAGVSDGAARFQTVKRDIGDMFPFVRFFVLDDLTATDWLECHGDLKPTMRRVCGVYQKICFALDALADAYEKNG